MRLIFGILASAAGIYSLLILIRIVLSWFGGITGGKPVALLAKVTDPYLDWWRSHLNLRIGVLDFSAVAGVVAVSLAQNIFYSLSNTGVIKLGNILAILLLSIWSITSFLLGLCLVIIILRLIAYVTNRDIYSPFWKAIDSISQPILYRTNRIIFGKKIGGFLKGIIISALLLAALMFAGNIAFNALAAMLTRLPI